MLSSRISKLKGVFDMKSNYTHTNENEMKLGYNPEEIKRELEKFYISMDEDQKNQIYSDLGISDSIELFNHIKDDVKFGAKEFSIGKELDYNELIENLESIASKNKPVLNFLGDGLPQMKQSEIVPFVCSIRGLTTAYTPYQPERSQGTLHTLWMYSSALKALTGFEGINASLYERSTCLFEALKTATRIQKKKNTVIVCESIYPSDKEVLETLKTQTDLKIVYSPINKESGLTDLDKLKSIIVEHKNDLAALAFNQINGLGLLEDVDQLTDICYESGIQSIAIIDPYTLSSNGLKKPSEYGSEALGCHMIVGEGQHLCLDAKFGGPGLGIFGIRFNEKNKTAIRSTPGRFVGKAKDLDGKDCLAMVLSTREQHIRREKATSNICSNQSFVATIAGASMYAKGDKGISESNKITRINMTNFLNEVLCLQGVELAFPSAAFNEVVLKLSKNSKTLFSDDLIPGKDISNRYGLSGNLLKISFNDLQNDEDINKLIATFAKNFEKSEKEISIPEIPENLRNSDNVKLKQFPLDELKEFYTNLGDLNVSPDDDIYPLGSCTMKYNPRINDWAAGLENFRMSHPDMPESHVQGCLEIIYHIQEDFKRITGLPGVTTQPVAGAQGELVGIKLFQAYHEDKASKKDLILIPRTAHGTNPATATMAGFETKNIDGKQVGIKTLAGGSNGQIDLEELKTIIECDGERVAGIMITNPNTAGIFEENFKEVADLIHSVDGLVYMDGANMNAIAGIVDLGKLGVDAVHNNLHKTWTIPHGGGGPGDAIVAVSEKLIPYLPGLQIKEENGVYSTFTTEKTIGSFHRHSGNFAHKVRAYTYIKALGTEGIKEMSKVAVLSANYLYHRLRKSFPTLPAGAKNTARMHEFIITISNETFERLATGGTPKAKAIASLGKLFLDFGLHAPTVAFPEVFGLMIEPTESFTKLELDRFADIVESILKISNEMPEIVSTTPHFTPVLKVDEVWANKNLCLNEVIDKLADLPRDRVSPKILREKPINEILELIIKAHKERI